MLVRIQFTHDVHVCRPNINLAGTLAALPWIRQKPRKTMDPRNVTMDKWIEEINCILSIVDAQRWG